MRKHPAVSLQHSSSAQPYEGRIRMQSRSGYSPAQIRVVAPQSRGTLFSEGLFANQSPSDNYNPPFAFRSGTNISHESSQTIEVAISPLSPGPACEYHNESTRECHNRSGRRSHFEGYDMLRDVTIRKFCIAFPGRTKRKPPDTSHPDIQPSRNKVVVAKLRIGATSSTTNLAVHRVATRDDP